MTQQMFYVAGAVALVVGIVLIAWGYSKEKKSGTPYTKQEKGMVYGGWALALAGAALLAWGYFGQPKGQIYYF